MRVMKTYGEFCSLARSLDVVGDRWALLVVRELLLGPRRFTDLVDGLPGVGTNVLSTRLRDLEAQGIIQRTHVPSPTPAVLYELTDDGRELKPVLDAFSRWGARRLTRAGAEDAVKPQWFALSLAANLPHERLDAGASYLLDIEDEQFTIRVGEHDVVATDATDDAPTATVTGRLRDFFAASKGDRRAAQQLTTAGDRSAAKKLVSALTGAMALTQESR
jgi:DNA-binding HxlR family transcriptional regulator